MHPTFVGRINIGCGARMNNSEVQNALPEIGRKESKTGQPVSLNESSGVKTVSDKGPGHLSICRDSRDAEAFSNAFNSTWWIIDLETGGSTLFAPDLAGRGFVWFAGELQGVRNHQDASMVH